ncbi:MAG: hypothetical protein U5O39_20635 [Gammaproteobacteria bacterium]|nr:hypothetical protein [Gammaproteobacteria bacterium]
MLVTLPERYPRFISEQMVSSWNELLTAEAGDIGQWLVSVSLSQLPFVLTLGVYIDVVPIVVFFMLKDQDAMLALARGFSAGKASAPRSTRW